jgi:pre-mRNA-splicing factor CWC22
MNSSGLYVPPKRKRALERSDEIPEDAEERQLEKWDDLRKGINRLVNIVNVSNIGGVIVDIFSLNLIRGRGLLIKSLLMAQTTSPTFTPVYSALLSVINVKLPDVGLIFIHRLIIQIQTSMKTQKKPLTLSSATMLAHLINYRIAHEVLALQFLSILLELPTDDSVEIAISFIRECGQSLQESSPLGMNALFDRLRDILHEGSLDKRSQYLIEQLFNDRRKKFCDYPSLREGLDLVEFDDQITHEVDFDEENLDPRYDLDSFTYEKDFISNNNEWNKIRDEILGDTTANDNEQMEAQADGAPETTTSEENQIVDLSETTLITLRKMIYLTIMNSLDFEECSHKLMKLSIPKGAEVELSNMLIECCSQEKTYMKYYGLIAARFCMISTAYRAEFENAFVEQYSTSHRLDTTKLRNVAKFFAHLLFSDALPWTVLKHVRLTEEATTSSSRIFLKVLMQELSYHLGLPSLRERMYDKANEESLQGIYPKSSLDDARFSINFFTSIGLGALTDNLRDWLKSNES